jgi:hypothetical protein
MKTKLLGLLALMSLLGAAVFHRLAGTMSNWKFLLAAVGLAVSVGSANATSVTFDWTEGYQGGSGTFTATADSGGGEYTITDITGAMEDGYWPAFDIIALYPANDINEGWFGANDNLLFSTSTPQLDDGGFAFETADGATWQIQWGGSEDGYVLSSNDGAGSDNDSFNATLVATPLPAALPLFAGGLGVMGLFGWRRKRKVAASLAAA